MSCFRPRIMWKPPAVKGGRYALTCRQAVPGSEPVPIACGSCEACDNRRAADWCWRIGKEFEACGRVGMFATLTLEGEHLPDDYNIDRRHYQAFLKRLRAHIDYTGGAGYAEGVDRLRVAGCGEYGGKKGRPHYHLVIMGWKASDLVPDLPSKGGFPQWASELLTRLWGLGRVWVGEVTQSSIAYVVGYFRKMQRGANAAEHYRTMVRQHPTTGELVTGQRPPFAIYSRGTKAKAGVRAGGLGMAWLVNDDGSVSAEAGHLTVRKPNPVVHVNASSLARGARLPGPLAQLPAPRGPVLSNVQATPRSVTRKWLDSLPAVKRDQVVAERREAAMKRGAELEAKGETTIARALTRELCAVLRMQGVLGVSERWPIERIREVERLIATARDHPTFDLEDLRAVQAGTFDAELRRARLQIEADDKDRLERAAGRGYVDGLAQAEAKATRRAPRAGAYRAWEERAADQADARFADELSKRRVRAALSGEAAP